ncbi:MAG: homing endonuclease associated repeat-containing protein [Candidatus Hodarchaeota archaeon]
MKPKKISRKDIIKRLQQFFHDYGRPPKRNEPGLEYLVYAARKEFGSWTHALRIAELQTYNEWKKRRMFPGQLRSLLDNNPMTMKEIKLKLAKNPRFGKCSSHIISPKISLTIRQSSDMKSIGPRMHKVYFIQGQENLAKKKLGKKALSNQDIKEIFLDCLKKPMTQDQLEPLFPNQKYRTRKCLRELVTSRLVGRIRFVAHAKGSAKYSATDLYGELAGKTYYYRLDSQSEIVDLILKKILDETLLLKKGFVAAMSMRLKTILSSEALNYWKNQVCEVREKYGIFL